MSSFISEILGFCALSGLGWLLCDTGYFVLHNMTEGRGLSITVVLFYFLFKSPANNQAFPCKFT